MKKEYKGLSNTGATCYMNSLLQTLYMTPEFRKSIYEWTYSNRVHPRPSDSILFQLQKLFAKLQLGFQGEVNTKDLIKSFQWDDEEAQMQNDIQQFNRVLFEAIDQSLLHSKNESFNTEFIRQLYEGQLVHYTKCYECNNQSLRQQIFQDINLTVKDIYEKVYNGSLQLAIQRYMKPQLLDENNLYQCSQCNKKVRAERGVKFIRMPKMFSVLLRRFTFDPFTDQRQKLNDRVQFPHILNFNNYIQGYGSIPNKINQDTSEYFLTTEVPKKKVTEASKKTFKKVSKNMQPAVANKIKTKPSAITKSFLQEMRKKKNQAKKEDQDLIYLAGGRVPEDNSQLKKAESATEEIHKPPFSQTVKPFSEEICLSDKETKKSAGSQKNQLKSTAFTNQVILNNQQTPKKDAILLPPPPQPPMLSEPYKMVESTDIKSQLQKIVTQKQQIEEQKEASLQAHHKKNKELIQQYLKDGALVYELYSVLVHSGGAMYGHYYCYLKSFQDGRWYCFNDQRVNEISVMEIEKTFGGSGMANAYALYYRLVEQTSTVELNIPSYIEVEISEELRMLKLREIQKIQNLQNIVPLKIHYQLFVQQIQIMKNASLELCLEKALQIFGIQNSIKRKNVRLRLYNPVSDTRLDTFTGREHLSLEQLKITNYKSMLLETKNDNEEFEEYHAGLMVIRVVFRQQCPKQLLSLEENHLKLHKVSINRYSPMSQIMQNVQKKHDEVLEPSGQGICIIKRHQNDEYSYHEIINTEEYYAKTAEELMIIENQILYVEQQTNELIWPKEFEQEVYRISILFNIPEKVQFQTSQNQPTLQTSLNKPKQQTLLTDSRKTLQQVKEQICKLIEHDPQDIILRRGSKSGMEIKTLGLSLKDNRFINGTNLHLEVGIPAKQGETRVQLYMAQDAPEHIVNHLHQFEFVADIPINGTHKASEVKAIFQSKLRKIKGIELQIPSFRIREKVCDKMGKIYRERPMKEQQLIEKRQIAIELAPDNLDPREFVIYVRLWDQANWQLSPKVEFKVSKSTTMKELAQLIADHYATGQSRVQEFIPLEHMEMCRILSIHKFKMLDLVQMEYYSMDSENLVIQEPLFVNTDGLLYILKNAQVEPPALTKQQEQTFGGTIRPIYRKSKPPIQLKTQKEKAIKIKVVEKEQDDSSYEIHNIQCDSQLNCKQQGQIMQNGSMPEEKEHQDKQKKIEF